MELKLTADKKLLDTLEQLIEAINACRLPNSTASVAEPASCVKEEPAPQEEAAQSEPEPEPAAPAYSKDEVQRMAIKKIQAGKRDAVKELIEKYGAERVGDVAEEKLAAFALELEAL